MSVSIMPTINKYLSILLLSASLCSINTVNAAPIKLKTNGVGDALIYPAFVGYFDNWFAIQNDSELWLQGHLRFRGSAWSAELLSFDVILAPGDVLWMRVADVDGDSQWEIDQSVDPLNFAYTGLQSACNNGAVPDCLEAQHALELSQGVVSTALINHQRNIGYIEFIGECELRGMTTAKMDVLLAGDNTGDMFHTNSLASSGTGTNCWAWSDAADGFVQDTNGPNGSYGLGDFPNVISGTGFIHLPDTTLGLVYNAEALVNFRTAQHLHRVDSYRVVNGIDLDAADSEASQRNRSVIVHDDNMLADGGGATPFGHYLYHFHSEPGTGNLTENRLDEALMSALTTVGPTLADGDDYGMTGNAQTINGAARNIYGGIGALRPVDITGEFDDWDSFHTSDATGPDTAGDGRINSIAEVEEAIRLGGQRFSSFYTDLADESMESWYFALFPTKIFYAEDEAVLPVSPDAISYRNVVVANLLVTAKPNDLEIWDTEMHTVTFPEFLFATCATIDACPEISISLSQALSIFNIISVKDIFEAFQSFHFQAGRVIVDMTPDGSDDPRNAFFGDLNPTLKLSWPGLMYTFEVESNFTAFGQWRSMQR